MARNKFDVDERLETPFDFRHLKRVGVYIGKHKWKMLLALLLSALASVTSLAVPKITQTVMDVAVPQKNVDLLLKMALAFMGIIIVGIVFTVIRSRIMAFVSQQIIYDIRKDLFAHLQQLPFAYYDSRPAGKILVRVINYVNSVSDILSNGIINSILEIINIIFIVVYMYTDAGDDCCGGAADFRGDYHHPEASSAPRVAESVEQKQQLQRVSGGIH